jgi:hypothetical protein
LSLLFDSSLFPRPLISLNVVDGACYWKAGVVWNAADAFTPNKFFGAVSAGGKETVCLF